MEHHRRLAEFFDVEFLEINRAKAYMHAPPAAIAELALAHLGELLAAAEHDSVSELSADVAERCDRAL